VIKPRKSVAMLTAQAALIIAGVAFVAVGITGAQQFVQIKIPELKPGSRWALGIIGAGMFACAFLIPTVTGSSSDQGSASAPQGGSTTSDSPIPIVSKSSESANPALIPRAPIVIIDSPKKNADVPEAGFNISGTVSSLGIATLWLFDYDGGSNYTIDEPVSVTSGNWSASDGSQGGSSVDLPLKLVIAIVAANQSCNATLNQLNAASRFNVSALPSGCKVVAENTVNVTKQ
jgi:hypothetical protein